MAERNSTQESVNGIEKALTGIEGFDEISGGLPRGRTTLVMGVTGAGKTVFALQTLVNRARQWAEPGIFVAFEENSRQIIANTAAFGWDLPALEQEKLFFLDARMSPDIVTAGEFDLIGLLASLEAKVNEMGAKRIVFDSVDVLLTLLDNPRTERQELYRIHDWLARMDLTGIMTARVEGSNLFTSTRYGFLQFMADCVVLLHHHVENRVSLREVRIVKYRGSTFAENEIPLVIGPTGIEIASFGIVEPDYEISSERISTGIPRLDDMLDGGYYRGTSILLTGAPGTAKSNLSGLFAEAVCQRGEQVLYVSFDESSKEIVRNLASIGVQFEPHLESGLLRMYSARTEARSAEEHFVRLIALIKQYQPSCLVINPLSALVQAAGQGERISALAVAQRLLHLAKLTGITVICTSLLEGDYPQVWGTPLQISPMADTWIHLSYALQGGERNRALSIIKSRGTRHSNQVREFLLSDQGIELMDVYTAEGTILMGTLRWERERAEQLEKERFRVALERKQRELELTETQINAQIEALQHELELRRTELRGLVNEQERREEQSSETRGGLGRLHTLDPDRSAPAVKVAPPEEGEGKRRTTSRRRKQNRPGDSS